jgi:dihydrodipicolinate synthase/N-acetylneuraminate lyase
MKGPYFSIPCFFKKDGDVDYTAIKNYCDLLGKNESIDVLYAMAYNTRYRQLNYQELLKVNKIVCDTANKYKKKAIIGHQYTLTQIELEKFCNDVKDYNPYAISVLFPERYYGVDSVLIDFYSVPSKFDINIMVHEQNLVSGFNGKLVQWNVELLEKVLEIKDVVAIKEDSKDDYITELVFEKCKPKEIDVVVAGGGKRRVKRLIHKIGLKTWLNGSLMLFPHLNKIVSNAYLENDLDVINSFEELIEIPYFDNFISKVGWHVGHKAALHFLGFCELQERKPMTCMDKITYEKYKPFLAQLKNNSLKFKNLHDK